MPKQTCSPNMQSKAAQNKCKCFQQLTRNLWEVTKTIILIIPLAWEVAKPIRLFGGTDPRPEVRHALN